jgi:hypothetical protein
MRFIFGLILVAGLVMVAYPRLAAGTAAGQTENRHVYDAQAGFMPAEVQLDAADAPVDVAVELTAKGLASAPKGAAILTVTVARGGETVLARALDFAGVPGRDINPQTGEKVFQAAAGVIDPVEPGSYTFTFTKGDAEGVTVSAVNLVLARHAVAVDRRLQPIGFSLLAIGFIGLILAFRHRKGGPPANPNSQPPPPRWGRGA